MGRKLKVREFGLSIKFHGFADLIAPDLRQVYVRDAIKAQQDRLDRMAWDVLKMPKVVKVKAPVWVLVGDAVCIRQTERALCVRVPRSYHNDPLKRLTTEIWVPKSQLHPSENEICAVGDKGFLVIPEWLAKEKGL